MGFRQNSSAAYICEKTISSSKYFFSKQDEHYCFVELFGLYHHMRGVGIITKSGVHFVQECVLLNFVLVIYFAITKNSTTMHRSEPEKKCMPVIHHI